MSPTLIASALALYLAPSPQDGGPTNLDKLALYNRIRGATVKVFAEFEKWKRHGTGVAFKSFGVGKDAYTVIVTNSHVIRREGAVSKKVSVVPFKANGRKLSAYVMFEYLDPATMYDLAFLVVKDENHLIKPAPVVPEVARFTWTQSVVYACGHPADEEFFVDDGRVMKVGNGRNQYVLEHDALVEHGNSGGGLFDSQGRLGAINTWLRDGKVGMALDVGSFTEIFSIRTTVVDAKNPEWTGEAPEYFVANGDPVLKAEGHPEGTNVFLLAIGRWQSSSNGSSVNAVGHFSSGPKVEPSFNYGSLLVRLGAETERAGRAHQGENGSQVTYKDAAIGSLKKGAGKLMFRINDAEPLDNTGSMRVIYLVTRPVQATSNRFIFSRISDTSSASR